MEKPLKILMLEDVSADAELIKIEMQSQNLNFEDHCVFTREDFIIGLTNFHPDVILSDFNLPSFDALDALEIRNKLSHETPFILVTGSQTEEIAVKCILAGADDYILKDSLTRLPSAIKNTLAKKHAEVEKKVVEIDLKDTRSLLEHIISSSPVVTYMQNVSENFTHEFSWVSDNISQILGYQPGEALQPGWWGNNIHSRDRELIDKTFNNIMESGTLNFEYRFRKKSGEYIWLQDAVKINYENNKPYEIIGTLANINDRKKAELAYQQSQAEYKELVENINEVIFSTDSNGDLTYISPVIAAMTGYDPNELLGKNYTSHILKNDKEKFELSMHSHLTGEDGKDEYRLQTKNGNIIWVKSSTRSIHRDNNVDGLMGIITDVTKEKLAEFALTHAKRRAEELNQVKTNLLANISHELRTPMIGILGFAEILEIELTDSELKEMASTIRSSGKRFLDTLNLLLEFSLTEIKGEGLKLSYFNYAEVANSLYKTFRPAALAKNIKLELKLPDEPSDIFLDERFYRSIINNLLSNAIKFTNKGSVVLFVGTEIMGDIKFLIISVSDTGIGIPKEKIPTIFEEFRQLSEGFSRNFEGTGLGLTIAKRYVEKLNGTITVHSEENVGTNFVVNIPLESTFIESENDFKDDSSLLPKALDVNLKILLVEDDPATSTLIKKFLLPVERIDYFIDGSIAINAAQQAKYDIVLMDINLGKNLDGIMVMKEIRKNPDYTDVPFIAITAYAMEKDKELFLKEGFNDYLSKPFTKSGLINIVHKNLRS